jgi:hypothetical protein
LNEEHSIFDLIENYHQGKLSEEEKKLVEKRIQTDPSFAEYVTINGLVNTLVYSSGLDILRERMTKDLVLLDQKRIRRRWAIGAGIIAVLVSITSLIYYSKYFANKNLFLPDIQKEQNDTRKTVDQTIIISEPIDKKDQINHSILKQSDKKQGIDTTDLKANNHSLPFVAEQKDTLVSIKQPNIEAGHTAHPVEIKNNNSKECNLSFEVTVQASCKGEGDGAILVEQQSISGGTMPYHFKIFDTREESSSGVFSNLEKGNYNVILYDSKGCSHLKEIVVPDKNCSSKKSYSFNPAYGESWKMSTLEEGESGSFTIFNRAGISIFKGSFTGSNAVEWFGTNTQGIPVEVGLYVCVIEYLSGKTEVIEISIVR